MKPVVYLFPFWSRSIQSTPPPYLLKIQFNIILTSTLVLSCVLPSVSSPKSCVHFSSLHTLSAQTKTCKRKSKSRCVFSESHLCRNDIWKLCSKTSCISSGVSFDTCISKKKCVHVCVNKTDLLLIIQPRTLRIDLLRLKHSQTSPSPHRQPGLNRNLQGSLRPSRLTERQPAKY